MPRTCHYCEKSIPDRRATSIYCSKSCVELARERLPKINRKLKQLEKLVAEVKGLVR